MDVVSDSTVDISNDSENNVDPLSDFISAVSEPSKLEAVVNFSWFHVVWVSAVFAEMNTDCDSLVDISEGPEENVDPVSDVVWAVSKASVLEVVVNFSGSVVYSDSSDSILPEVDIVSNSPIDIAVDPEDKDDPMYDFV